MRFWMTDRSCRTERSRSAGCPQGIPVASERAYGTHQPSHGWYAQPSLPVPTYDFTLHSADVSPASQLSDAMLVGTDCPSFPGPDHVWRAFSARALVLDKGPTAPRI